MITPALATAATPTPDADLLRLCVEFHRQRTTTSGIEPGDDAALEERWQKVRLIAAMRPRTDAGRRAKAGVGVALLMEDHGPEHARSRARFALNVLRDVAAPVADIPAAPPGNSDVDLIEACRAFIAADDAIRMADAVDDDTVDPDLKIWEGTLDRAIAFPATTVPGLYAKASVATAALRLRIHELEREESAAFSVAVDTIAVLGAAEIPDDETETELASEGDGEQDLSITSVAKIDFDAMSLDLKAMPLAQFLANAENAHGILQLGAMMLTRTPDELAEMFKRMRTKADDQGKSAVGAISEIIETKEWFDGYAKLLECVQARAFVGLARAVDPSPG